MTPAAGCQRVLRARWVTVRLTSRHRHSRTEERNIIAGGRLVRTHSAIRRVRTCMMRKATRAAASCMAALVLVGSSGCTPDGASLRWMLATATRRRLAFAWAACPRMTRVPAWIPPSPRDRPPHDTCTNAVPLALEALSYRLRHHYDGEALLPKHAIRPSGFLRLCRPATGTVRQVTPGGETAC